MATPQEQRKIRLKNDYKAMQNIQGSIINWRPLSGTAPYIEDYELTVNVRSIIGSSPSYRERHVIKVTIPSDYPRSAPQAIMQTSPPPYHPNWYENGRWCYGTWNISERLADYIIRMVRTLQFDKEITNPNSPANSNANSWYARKSNTSLFPCDKQTLPDPAGKKFSVSKKKFTIQG